ncbi:36667_t:CDS:2 [Gigaspora margarita]|uniref:36667_t:CDS:1 n=1 Tax=Gigaspora margarita TaxID=4874 RepID=A0ABN7URK2_GIGMA|nr:36667_t:CDS:2 [Gigaspora margarita]
MNSMANFFGDECQADRSFFLSDITNDNFMENFQTVLPMTYSDSFKEFQPSPPFFLNDINDDNLTENFQNVLPMIECSDNFKEQGIDIEPQNYMVIEVQGSIDKELSQEKIVTHLKQVDNNSTIVSVLHIFNQLRTPYAYTTKTGQHIQKKVKYAYSFKKMKAVLNLALDIGCEGELINIISGFIDWKKNSLNNENNKNYENLHVLDPLVQKLYGRRPTKQKSNHDRNTVVRTPLNALNSNSNEINSSISAETSQGIKENTTKWKYVCNTCGKSGHNARSCNK